MFALELRNVTKKFANLCALADVTLGVRKGEFVSFLGPSGSGKTTTLRTIAGLTLPDSGEIFIDGKLVNAVPVHKRNLGMVFQNYALFPHLKVSENVAFGLRFRGLDKKTMENKTREMLELVRLPDSGDRFPNQLSGGQQQRIALARALAVEPSVLLLDEPLGALDKKLREEMQVELKNLLKRLNTTTIFVTHDQEEALTMSDRVAIMKDGRIQQFDSPINIYEKPATRFVSDFVGVSNFLDGIVVREEDDFLVAESAGGLELFIPRKLCTFHKGEKVTMVLRPEKIKMGSLPPRERRNIFECTIENSVYLGTVTHYYVKTKGENLVVYVQNTNKVEGDESLLFREGVYVYWEPENILVREQ